MEMKPSATVFELTLKVTAADLQALLDATASHWDKKRIKVEDLTAKQLKLLKRDLDVKQMLEEFIENSDEAQANDWMADFIDTMEDEE
jgi:hypothetical protein